ncbi:MAG TPA: molybdenum ABC transporter ATP-binding protein [Rhizomicrobium sp.]|jgi:molybdate transport system ATP-binding protein|nr:molybdenum ABC transporter ATP-binding protein [Rhizomicrobium sp.]
MSVEIALRHDFPGFALDIAFALPKPGVTALFGVSGAGKTTIVNAIAGTFRPREGRIVINGRVVLDTKADIFVPPEQRRTGYVFQDAKLFPHMSVQDNLLFGRRRAAAPASADEVDSVIALLGLAHLLQRRPQALSGGEKGRVALGRALLSSPEILLLDEPLAALDAQRRAEILPYLERLRDAARLPMLLVSHALEEVARLADDIVVVQAGKVAAQGSVFDILTGLELPALAGTPPVGAIVPAVLGAHLPNGLARLDFAGGALFAAGLKDPIGTPLRVRVRAEEIMLALPPAPQGLSANNILPAHILAIGGTGDSHADVQLDCGGGTRMVARITRASVTALGLKPGLAVFAIIKSMAVDALTAHRLSGL